VAARVAEVIFDRGLGRVERPTDINEFIRTHAYVPRYGGLA
jgi:malate dehydrogenase (oxaloacetate-decarboxylating)(NADP+)